MKQELLQRLIKQLEQNIKDIEIYVVSSQEEAIQAPGAMQSHHDTTKSEAGYRVNGLIQRKAFLLQAIQALNDFIPQIPPICAKIELGAYTTIQDNQNNKRNYLILPAGEGEVIKQEDLSSHVFILSPNSPLFPLLENKKLNDTYIFRDKQFTITHIQ